MSKNFKKHRNNIMFNDKVQELFCEKSYRLGITKSAYLAFLVYNDNKGEVINYD